MSSAVLTVTRTWKWPIDWVENRDDSITSALKARRWKRTIENANCVVPVVTEFLSLSFSFSFQPTFSLLVFLGWGKFVINLRHGHCHLSRWHLPRKKVEVNFKKKREIQREIEDAIEGGNANLMIDNGWMKENLKNLLRRQIDWGKRVSRYFIH